MATQPPKPKGVGVETPATVTLTSLRGMFTFSTLSLKSPCFPSVESTCWYSAGMSCALADDGPYASAPATIDRAAHDLIVIVLSPGFTVHSPSPRRRVPILTERSGTG